MMNRITRRRFISIAAAATGASLTLPTIGMASTPTLHRWQGRALGAQAEILLNVPSDVDGGTLVKAITNEISRLEAIFSLYQADSAITRLNEQGYLIGPPIELVDVLHQARDVSLKTKGAFDITVQPLWQLYHENADMKIASQLRQKVLGLIDYNAVLLDDEKVSFGKPGMAITLNGIAQGYITDRLTRLLASYGLDNSLIQLGETRALGSYPDGRDWRVGLKSSPSTKINLCNQSLATSAGGMARNHIFDPRTGQALKMYDSVSVVASTATLADSLSTAFVLMPEKEIYTITKQIAGVKTILVRGASITKIGVNVPDHS